MSNRVNAHGNLRRGYKRTCCDCGRPTNDYRCRACWKKIREGSEYYMKPENYHGAESMEAGHVLS